MAATLTRPRCSLCHGNAGHLNEAGAHNLCAARAAHGLSTPSLGDVCLTCHGTGTTGRAGVCVFLSLDLGPARIARSLAAQFPPCPACAGRGYTAEEAR